MALPLALRNRLAELIVGALEAEEARRAIEALAGFCQAPDGRVGAEAGTLLRQLGWFRAAGPGPVRLLGAHEAHRPVLCRRVLAARAALSALPPPATDALTTALGRAACLADRGLFFELHELLEPLWLRAQGTVRVALQGLIQVAVALEHAEQQNREGAVSLLAEGAAKLAEAGGALPLDIVSWSPYLAATLAALRQGAPLPPAPPWPRPRAPRPAPEVRAAWPSS